MACYLWSWVVCVCFFRCESPCLSCTVWVCAMHTERRKKIDVEFILSQCAQCTEEHTHQVSSTYTVNSSTWKIYFIILFDTCFFVVVVVFVFVFLIQLSTLKHLMVFKMHFNGFGKRNHTHTHTKKWNAYSEGLILLKMLLFWKLSWKHHFQPEIT